MLAKGILSIFETVTPAFYIAATHQDSGSRFHGWSLSDQISVFLLLLGAVGFVMLGLLAFRHDLPEHIVNAVAFLFIAVGTAFTALLMVHKSLAILIVSELLVWSIGAPIAGASVVSAFSHIIGGGGRPQGLAMGWIGSAGSAGRIIAPIVTAWVDHRHMGALWLMFLGVCAFVGALGVLRFNQKVLEWRSSHRDLTGFKV
jgi:MFS family permease